MVSLLTSIKHFFRDLNPIVRAGAGLLSANLFDWAWTMTQNGEYLPALIVNIVAVVFAFIAVYGWSGIPQQTGATKVLKLAVCVGAVFWGGYSAVVIWRSKGTKPWTSLTWDDLTTVRSYGTYFVMVSWRWLAITLAVFFAFLIGRWSRRQLEPTKKGNGAVTDQALSLSNTLTCEDPWLHEALKTDRESIAYLVKVFLADWHPEFSPDVLQPYIDFRLAVSNLSLCLVRIEDPITGYITFLKEGAEKRSSFREEAGLPPNQELYLLPKKPGILLIRQYLDRKEADEIQASGPRSQFWLHELNVYFYGDEIDRTRLYTRQIIKKNEKWITDPALYFAYDDETVLAHKIETLLAEADSLRSQLQGQFVLELETEATSPASSTSHVVIHLPRSEAPDVRNAQAKLKIRFNNTTDQGNRITSVEVGILRKLEDGSEQIVIAPEIMGSCQRDKAYGNHMLTRMPIAPNEITDYCWLFYHFAVKNRSDFDGAFIRITMDALRQSKQVLDYGVDWDEAMESNYSDLTRLLN